MWLFVSCTTYIDVVETAELQGVVLVNSWPNIFTASAVFDMLQLTHARHISQSRLDFCHVWNLKLQTDHLHDSGLDELSSLFSYYNISKLNGNYYYQENSPWNKIYNQLLLYFSINFMQLCLGSAARLETMTYKSKSKTYEASCKQFKNLLR